MNDKTKEELKPKLYACPECKSDRVARMYGGFYALVNAETGEDLEPNFQGHESNTELTDQCSCFSCGHEWELD